MQTDVWWKASKSKRNTALVAENQDTTLIAENENTTSVIENENRAPVAENRNRAPVADGWHSKPWKMLFLGLLLGPPSPAVFFLELYALVSAFKDNKVPDGGVAGDLFIALIVFEAIILTVAASGPFHGFYGGWVKLEPLVHCICCLFLLAPTSLAVAYLFMITGDDDPWHALGNAFGAGQLPKSIRFSFVAAIIEALRFFLLLALGFWKTASSRTSKITISRRHTPEAAETARPAGGDEVQGNAPSSNVDNEQLTRESTLET